MCAMTGASAQACSAFKPIFPSLKNNSEKLLSNQIALPSPCSRCLPRSDHVSYEPVSRITYMFNHIKL